MKALILEANGKLNYKDAPDPVAAPDECLISVEYAGICNSDISRAYDNGAYSYPLIMGHEFSGTVEEAGANVSAFKRGDRVAAFPLIPCMKCAFCTAKNYAQCANYDYYGSRRHGAFAEFVAIKEWNLFPIPDGVPLDMAALLEPVSVAMHAVRKLRFKRDDTVAILGAGLIGAVIARYLSNVIERRNIFLIDRNEHKLCALREAGVNAINTQADAKWAESLKRVTGGGVSHAIEACGSAETFRQSIDLVKNLGNILWIGNIKGDLTVEKKAVSSILRREARIIGSWNSSFSHDRDDDWSAALRFIEASPGRDAFGIEMAGLEEGASVFERLFSGKATGRKDRAGIFIKRMFAVARRP